MHIRAAGEDEDRRSVGVIRQKDIHRRFGRVGIGVLALNDAGGVIPKLDARRGLRDGAIRHAHGNEEEKSQSHADFTGRPAVKPGRSAWLAPRPARRWWWNRHP